MKNHVRSAANIVVLLAATTCRARAADLEGMPAIWSGVPRSEASSFAGFYGGATIGYGFGSGGLFGGNTHHGDGPVYSALAGYNFVNGRFLYGLEGEVMRGSLGASALSGAANVNTFLDYQATARARAGFLFTPSLLLYGKLGASYAGMTFNDTATATSASARFYGWTTGVGAEWKMTDTIGLRLDYDYNSFKANDVTFPASVNSVKPQFNTVRLGATVKF